MTITLRQESANGATTKGSALDFAELDNNFIHLLRASSVTVRGDSGTDQSLGEADKDSILNFVGGTNVTTTIGSDSAGDTQITIDATTSGLTDIVDDLTPQLGADLDVNGNAIVSASNGNIEIAPNGTGKTFITNGVFDIQTASPTITTTTTNGNMTLSANGTGYILLNQVGGVVVTDTGASGSGVLTGATSKGIALLTNAGAQGVNDPQLGLSNGGGISITPGATSTTTFNGTNVSNMQLKDYKETVYTGGSTTGTITPDVANGNVQAITLTGNITFNAFANAEAGQSMTLIVTQSATGGETLTSTMKFAGGTKTLSTGANEIDIISVFYDGTNYYANLATNFS